MKYCFVLLFAAFLPLWGATTPSDDEFRKLADRYFEEVYFRYAPSTGTYLGLHQYDRLLEDFSAQAIADQQRDLHVWEKRIAKVEAANLGEMAQADRLIVMNSIRSALLTSEQIRPWEKNPDVYSSSLASSAFLLMERKFAPPEERLRSVIARERQMPAVLKAARANLKNPPHVYTDIALRQLPGNISFFEKDLTAAFKEVKDTALLAEFKAANGSVLEALRNYEGWLRSDLLPRSKGDFRIGAKAFGAKVFYDEMVDLPLPQLLDYAYSDLHKNQQAFQRIARQVNSAAKPAAVLEELGSDHPAPDKLLDTFRQTFDGLIRFIQAKHIIEIPADVRPTLEETPPFMRATTFASMDTPGPFETKAREAFFNVTLPEKDWNAARVNSFMRTFSFSTIVSISVHEAYPGHYVQLLYSSQAPSRVRKILGANSNVEGWAHYCEQMMMDEGYAEAASDGNKRRADLIHLGQLQEALLRDARYIVGLKMHTGQMSMEEARKFFVDEGYQSEESARVETDRGTADPTYLYYTLGKLEILKLRADLQKKQGTAFSLEKFHTDFVRQGYPPIRVIRRALLRDDSAPL